MDCIEFKNASFRYPNGTLANEELNLRIEQGERVAIIGQNGAGKTTAVKMMNGLHKPTQGDVIVNGVNTKERTTAQISHMVGYVFQNPDDQIFNTTVRAELEFWPKYQKLPQEDMDARVARAVEMTGIRQYMDLTRTRFLIPPKNSCPSRPFLQCRRLILCWTNPLPGRISMA